MPIRFRCAYCSQLMGIAHRKAGTVVRCPTCAGQVIVPHPTEAGNPRPDQPGDERKRLVFERSDFDELFRPDKGGRPPKAMTSEGAGEPAALPSSGKWKPPAADVHPEADIDIDVEREPEIPESPAAVESSTA